MVLFGNIIWSHIPLRSSTINGTNFILSVLGWLLFPRGCLVGMRGREVPLNLFHLDILELKLYDFDLIKHAFLIAFFILLDLLQDGLDTNHR